MGQPKMLLPWCGTTVLGHLVEQWGRAGATQIAVVHAAGDSGIVAELDRLGIGENQRVANHDPTRGMFSSIRCAAGWENWQRLPHVAFALGDQPHVPLTTLEALAQFAAVHLRKICQPSRAGRPRHPVFFPKELFESLAGSKAETFKEFLVPYADERQLLELDDPALDLDIDTPADYAAARERFTSG